MAKIMDYSPLYYVRGALRNLVVRSRMGRVELIAKPVFRKRKFSPSQLAQQRNMKKGNAYAKMAMQNPELKQFYQRKAGITMHAFQAAVRDKMNPPTIHRINPKPWIDSSSGAIIIIVKDDTKVTEVEVAIFSNQDQLLDTGLAKPNGLYWKYFPSLESGFEKGHLKVIARDLAGNETEGILSFDH